MLGAIIGDVVGSQFSAASLNVKTKNFELFTDGCSFTDDTVCTVAIADTLLGHRDFASSLRHWCRKYPHRGYGSNFNGWVQQDDAPAYDSWGNGAPMRVSPIGHLLDDEAEALDLAEQSSIVSHNHPEAIRGVKALTSAILMARKGASQKEIGDFTQKRYDYAMWESIPDLRRSMTYTTESSVTVPAAIICALRAKDFEDAIRNAVSIGGDSDTIACMAGALAEGLFEIPQEIEEVCMSYLDDEIRDVVWNFYSAQQLKLDDKHENSVGRL